MTDHCEKPFWKDISVLFRDFTLQYRPECEGNIWNFGARLLTIALLIGMIGSIFAGLNSFIIAILFAVITGIVIILTTRVRTNENDKRCDKYHTLPYITEVEVKPVIEPTQSENFTNMPSGSNFGVIDSGVMGILEVDAMPYSGPALPDFTPPTSRNPFMNVLLDEIKYNPDRPSAASVSNPTVKQTLDDYFRVQWFSDPTDVFGKNQGQRQFVTQPSTSVPNDRESYQNWLYKIPGKTCKEGGREACLSSCDGSPVTWLNQDS